MYIYIRSKLSHEVVSSIVPGRYTRTCCAYVCKFTHDCHMISDDITQAIKSMLYIREVSIIHALHDCLVILLPVLEGPPPITVTAPRKVWFWSHDLEPFRCITCHMTYIYPHVCHNLHPIRCIALCMSHDLLIIQTSWYSGHTTLYAN